ncbi:response regulator [Cohnella sp. WQ 127256]|uniref:response regulator n=1 Tax=Cohnella sp. WQ 127256 TaxID=2938790 RepID=UPI0021189BF9
MIQAFIVDDEEHALNILELFLERIGGVEVIGRSNNGFDALHQLLALKPDVLFLDIEMPEMNGIELAEIIRNDNSDVQIIFVTAYDQYAISAFEQAAIDYILKPLELDRLSKTITRLRKEIGNLGMFSKEQSKKEDSLVVARDAEPKLSIRLLGQYLVEVEGGPRLKWRTSKEKELLAYLAIHGDSRVHRDHIIEDLWPDDNYNKAKVYLHTCISLIRKNIKQLGLSGILRYENERYFLDPDRVEVDVKEYQKWMKNLKGTDNLTPHDIEKALTYHQGMLLTDEDYVWAEQEAELLDNSTAQWQIVLAESYLKMQEYDKAIEIALRTIDYSPYNEESYRLLMRGYQRLGRNDQVLLVYRRLTQKLDELQIKPSMITIQLYEEISA